MQLDIFTNTLAFEDLDTEDPHAEIYAASRQLVAIIRQTEGIDNPTLEIWPQADGKNWELDFKPFLKACQNAYSRLKDFQLPEEFMPLAIRPAEEVNCHGQQELEKILRHPDLMVQTNRKGGKDYFLPGGKGVRFSQSGGFETFLEPEIGD